MPLNTGIALVAIDDLVVISLQHDLDDEMFEKLGQQIRHELVARKPRAVVFDLGGVAMLDGFMAASLDALGQSCRVLGVQPFMVHVRPAVALLLARSGRRLDSLRAVRSLDAVRAALDAAAGEV